MTAPAQWFRAEQNRKPNEAYRWFLPRQFEQPHHSFRIEEEHLHEPALLSTLRPAQIKAKASFHKSAEQSSDWMTACKQIKLGKNNNNESNDAMETATTQLSALFRIWLQA